MADSQWQAPALKIGFVVNPLAGIGGAVGLQGSDGVSVQQEAIKRQGQPQAPERVRVFLQALMQDLGAEFEQLAWLTWGGAMGFELLRANDITARVLGQPQQVTDAADTRQAIGALCSNDIDLLLFVGGDGTARDVLAAVAPQTCVLGLPAGVKMHSGVFAISPSAAAVVVAGLLRGSMIGRLSREVRDYAGDLQAAAGQVITQRFGELWVPEAGGFLQQMKIGGKEDEALVVQEIVAYFLDNPDIYQNKALVVGPGSTCLAVKQALGVGGTLLGCDVLLADGSSMANATRQQLEQLVQETPVHLLLSFTRHQGFLLGRGNQQFSAELIAALDWTEDVTVLGSRTKLASLDHRPMLVDSGNKALDGQISGLTSVLAGYDDFLLYRVSDTLLSASSA